LLSLSFHDCKALHTDNIPWWEKQRPSTPGELPHKLPINLVLRMPRNSLLPNKHTLPRIKLLILPKLLVAMAFLSHRLREMLI
jgi:hypothetical protein